LAKPVDRGRGIDQQLSLPEGGAVLRCEQGPDVGGDTMWNSMVMAYDRLPTAIKQRIEGACRTHLVSRGVVFNTFLN